MNSNFLKRTISLALSLVSLVSVATFGLAKADAAQNGISQSESDALWAKVETQRICADKDANKNMRLSRMAEAENIYPTRKGTILVTKDKLLGVLSIGHAAIIYDDDTVIESVSDGVIMGKNDWHTTRETCYGLSVNGTTLEQDALAAEWCKDKIGLDYNWNFWNIETRESFYCSQLVWAAFYDNFGIDLSTSDFGDAIHPAELIESENTTTIYCQ